MGPVDVELGAGEHGRLHRVDGAGDDGLQGEHDLRSDDKGVDNQVWAGGVTSAAGDHDLEVVLAGHDGAGRGVQVTRRNARQVVQAVQRVDRKSVQQPVVEHGLGATAGFLGGLEDDADRAVETSVGGEDCRGPEDHGHVGVVPAAARRPERPQGPAQSRRQRRAGS